MNPLPAISLSLLLLSSVSSSAAMLSAKTNGLYVAVGGSRTNSNGTTHLVVDASEQLLLQAFSDSSPAELAYPGLDYCLDFTLRAPDGRLVKKTALGKRAGAHFGALPHPTKTHVGLMFAWGPYSANPGLGGGKPIGKPEDLFAIKVPGTYELMVRVVLYRRQMSSTTASWQPIAFSPLILSIDKRKK